MKAWWCSRGGLFTIVDAPTRDSAQLKAAQAFSRRARSPLAFDPDSIRTRTATARDKRLWAQLIAQGMIDVPKPVVADARVDEAPLFP